MNTGGEAGEQLVRMSLNGVEVAAKITGAGAKQLAVLLYTIFKEQDKSKGAARLSSMLRSGKELKVFTVRQSELKTFAKEAKRYGVLYCALKGIRKSPDGMVDIMVRAEDAAKINRIVERFELAVVDKASVNEVVKDSGEMTGQTAEGQEKTDVPELTREESEQAENLLDELMGTGKTESSREQEKTEPEQGKPEPEKTQKKKKEKESPIQDRPERKDKDKTTGEPPGQTNARLSGPISGKQESSGRTSSDDRKGERRSVRAELEQIRQSRKQEAKKAKAEPEKEQQKQGQQPGPKPVAHQQPEKRRRKGKER